MQKNRFSMWLSEKESHIFLGIGLASLALLIASAAYSGALYLP
ncbi:MAG: hypothetical protein ACI4LJ_03860 [Anaerovoracaceae bacterium]